MAMASDGATIDRAVTTMTPVKQDLWTLLHDLIFSIPAPVLAPVAYATAVLAIVALVGCTWRVWQGDQFELGPLKLRRPDLLRNLHAALEGMSRDDQLKTNVLWMFRDRLNEAKLIVGAGVNEGRVRAWCDDVLTDVATALSRGGYDRHRVSLWVRGADGLRMFNGNGFRQAAVDRATLPLASIAGNVVRTGMSYNSSDISADRTFFPKPRSGRPYQSLLAVPVKTAAGETIATLCVDAEARGYFDRDDEFFAGCFADLIALLVAQVVTGDET